LTFHEYFAAREIVPVLTPGIKDSFVPASELRHGKSMARSFVECRDVAQCLSAAIDEANDNC